MDLNSLILIIIKSNCLWDLVIFISQSHLRFTTQDHDKRNLIRENERDREKSYFILRKY